MVLDLMVMIFVLMVCVLMSIMVPGSSNGRSLWRQGPSSLSRGSRGRHRGLEVEQAGAADHGHQVEHATHGEEVPLLR
jgi:hypothetical protein